MSPAFRGHRKRLLYSYRGIGKTFLALGIATAIAGGGHFLRWAAPRSSKPRSIFDGSWATGKKKRSVILKTKRRFQSRAKVDAEGVFSHVLGPDPNYYHMMIFVGGLTL